MISQTNVPIMQKAVRVIYDMSEDTRTRELIREREKAMFDEASALGSARREGKAEGIAKGAANREAEIIESLKAYGMSEEQIRAALSAKK